MNVAMKTILRTDRLLLREFLPDDAPDMYALNADPEVIRYTGDPPFASVEAAGHFLASYTHYRDYGMGRWAVLDRGAGSFLGWCGLKTHPGKFVDLGYRFFRKYWGKGYATEAAQACLEYGFSGLGLTEIVGRVAEQNKASVRVLEKIGMTYWKKEACHGMEDVLYYRIARPQ